MEDHSMDAQRAKCPRCGKVRELVCEECYEEDGGEIDRMYKVGVSSGLKRAAIEIQRLATSAFISGEDEKSRMLRDICKGLEEQAEKQHPGDRG